MTFPWLAFGAFGAAALAYGSARISRQFAVAAIAGSAVILLLHGPLYFHYTSDDAYISYRYARNFADGAGLVWNRGDWVEGYSNFLWVLTLAGLRKLGVDVVFGGRWLGFALAVAGSAGTYLLATRLVRGVAGRYAGLAASLLLASCGTWAVWSSAGLEGPLFAALVLTAVLLHLQEADVPLAPPYSGAMWALASLTRPDGVVLFAVSGAFKLGEVIVRQRGAGRTPITLRREALSLATWGAGFALIFVPYWIWRWGAYGSFFPNTYYAKVGSGLDQYRRGLRYLGEFGQEYAVWLVLLAPIAAALTSIRRGPTLYVLALIGGWVAYVVYIGGDALVRFRFFVPVLPLEMALVASSGAAIVADLVSGRDRRIVEAACVIATAGLFGFTLYASGADFGLPPERLAVSQRAEIGRWLRGNVPPTTTIAVIPAGAIPYESRLPAIDMLGLNDQHIAHRHLDIGLLPAGHEKYDSQYVLDRRPDIIILMDFLSDRPWSRSDYDVLSGGLIVARIDMLKQPRLWTDYEPRAVQIREGEWFDLLVRRDAGAVLEKTAPTGP